MKTVLHICLAINYLEGWAYQENMLPAAHKELGFVVHIIAAEQYYDEHKKVVVNRPIGEYVNEDGVTVHILPGVTTNYSLNRILPKVKGLYKAIEAINPNVIFWHGLDPCSYNSYQVSWYVKKYPNVKLFADCHADYFNRRFSEHPIKCKIDILISKFWYFPYFKLADKIWGTTPWRVVFLKKEYGLPDEKVGCLLMGADDKHIVGKDAGKVRKQVRDCYSIPQNAFLIVTGGKLDERKNIHILCSAVRDIGHPVHLLIFGKPTPEMEPVFDTYKNCNNITQLGWIDGTATYDLFLAADLACFPGSHSVLWEQSVACGVPGIYKHWDYMTHVNEGGNANFIKDINEKSLREEIQSLLVGDKYAKMKRAASECASNFLMSYVAKIAIGE